eukprot:2342008-Rhodomonas_salina.4
MVVEHSPAGLEATMVYVFPGSTVRHLSTKQAVPGGRYGGSSTWREGERRSGTTILHVSTSVCIKMRVGKPLTDPVMLPFVLSNASPDGKAGSMLQNRGSVPSHTATLCRMGLRYA